MTALSVPTDFNAEILSHDYNGAGHALFCRLLREPGNIVLSPLSIGAAMTMAQVGARGETEKEIAQLFTPSLSGSERETAYAALLGIIDRYNTAPATAEDSEPIDVSGDFGVRAHRCEPPQTKIAVANALAIMRPNLVLMENIANLFKNYSAELLEVATTEKINAWLCRRTNGKIERIIHGINPETAATIINALYFRANWLSAFARDLSCDGDFHLASGKTVKTLMMHNPGISLGVARGEGYRAIRLPHVERRLGMTIVVPDHGQDIGSVAEHLRAGELARLRKAITGAAHKIFYLTMPKFKVSIELPLAQHFKALGIQLAFDAQRADFANIAAQPDRPFWIDEVHHCMVVDVNEEGTEAAAVTMAALMGGSLEPPKAKQFKVDRPFLFYVTDETGIILFQGKVADPRLL